MCTEVEEPKVSVIIPMHNAQEYIKEAVKSVENQTLRELEIIIIDDQLIIHRSLSKELQNVTKEWCF